MKNKRVIVLYFLMGMVPTEEEMAEGRKLQASFRNARLVEGPVEQCDFVAGAVPDAYAHLPRAKLGEDGNISFDATSGEQVGAFYLHQVARGQWNVFDEDGNQLNEEPLNKADARALALDNTAED